jgi:predicted nucleic acid-binding protein
VKAAPSDSNSWCLVPPSIPSGACRDKDDDNVLACALEADADYLVSGAKDLLHLTVSRGVRIITPRDFELLFDS